MRSAFIAIAALGSCLAQPAAAEVTQASPEGFATLSTATVAADPEAVWAALVEPARWWNGDHSWSADAANLSLDPRAGGCFCERVPGIAGFSDGSAEHMRVINIIPGLQLRMRGALGPLQGEALDGVLTIELNPATGGAEGTEIRFAYVVGGYARFPLEQVAPAVDGVITEQLGRLANLLDSGTP